MTVNRMKARADAVVDKRLDKLGRALGTEMLGRIMQKTPVDTGRARANWNASVGTPDETTHERASGLPFGAADPVALAKGHSVIRGFRLSDKEPLYITNGLPYAWPLEEGSSTQAPNGMAQVTVRELKPLAQKIGARLNRG